MGSYSIEWKSSALRELRKLPKQVLDRILPAVASLSTDPRPQGVRKLSGSDHTYRIRVGDYRIVYDVLDLRLVILIIRVRDRKDAYK